MFSLSAEGSPLSEPGEARARQHETRQHETRQHETTRRAPKAPRSTPIRARAACAGRCISTRRAACPSSSSSATTARRRRPVSSCACRFLDHALAEYVSALPDDRRVRGMATKWILREACKPLIPGWSRGAKGRLPERCAIGLRNELRDTLLEQPAKRRLAHAARTTPRRRWTAC